MCQHLQFKKHAQSLILWALNLENYRTLCHNTNDESVQYIAVKFVFTTKSLRWPMNFLNCYLHLKFQAVHKWRRAFWRIGKLISISLASMLMSWTSLPQTICLLWLRCHGFTLTWGSKDDRSNFYSHRCFHMGEDIRCHHSPICRTTVSGQQIIGRVSSEFIHASDYWEDLCTVFYLILDKAEKPVHLLTTDSSSWVRAFNIILLILVHKSDSLLQFV